jgi:hypothetical protein
MKLKLTILLALFAAGITASIALADNGGDAKKADGKCKNVHISGTIAPQTLAVTVDKASSKSLVAAGTQLSLAVGAAGQTVKIKAEACATGTGTALVWTVKQVELRPVKVKPAPPAASTSTEKKKDDHGKKGTTTAATTTAATTTTAP